MPHTLEYQQSQVSVTIVPTLLSLSLSQYSATEGDTSVAPPTVIMDTPDHNDDADEEEKGVAEDDKEYIVGADSTPLAPPTIEKSDPLQSVDTTNEKPEGENRKKFKIFFTPIY